MTNWKSLEQVLAAAYERPSAETAEPAVRAAELVALSYVPHTWKFLWAPIADTTLTRKRWYVFSALVTAVGIYVTGAVPANEGSLPLLTAVVLISNLAVTFLAMAVESLMAYDAPDNAKGRAGGWFQAGNLGGMGLGGGAGLWMAQNVPPPWIGSAALGATCLLCCAALVFVAEPPSTHSAVLSSTATSTGSSTLRAKHAPSVFTYS